MRLAVISDIHSNLDALKAVLTDISKQSIDDIISLGDNIGYGSEPEAVIANLKRHSIKSVLGNHEFALLDEDYLKMLNPDASKALLINRKKLSDQAKYYISTLKPFLVRHGCRFVHGVPPDSITDYIFKEPDWNLINIIERLEERIAFVGHTHQLEIYELDNGVLKKKVLMEKKIVLAKSRKYIINAGSVGQPRNGYNEAKYVIWDIDQNTIEARFVSYDYHKAAMKIRKAGIPRLYSDLLEKAGI